MAAPTGLNNINLLQSEMHQSRASGDFMATGVADASFQSQITGLLNTGISSDQLELTNHVGRAYYKKLNEFSLTPAYTDEQDAGFRPLTYTGLYSI